MACAYAIDALWMVQALSLGLAFGRPVRRPFGTIHFHALLIPPIYILRFFSSDVGALMFLGGLVLLVLAVRRDVVNRTGQPT